MRKNGQNKDINLLQSSKPMAYDDIRLRKQVVLRKIRREQSRIKYLTEQIVEDYHHPFGDGLFSIPNLKRAGSVVGGIFYAYRVLKSVSRVIGLFRRR